MNTNGFTETFPSFTSVYFTTVWQILNKFFSWKTEVRNTNELYLCVCCVYVVCVCVRVSAVCACVRVCTATGGLVNT